MQFWQTGFRKAGWELLKSEWKITFSSNHFVEFFMLCSKGQWGQLLISAAQLSVRSSRWARPFLGTGGSDCLWGLGWDPGTERGGPGALRCSVQNIFFQHIYSQGPTPKVFLVSYSEKSFSSLKCWGKYKIKTLGLKISQLGAGVRGTQEGWWPFSRVEILFKVGGRVAGGQVEYR